MQFKRKLLSFITPLMISSGVVLSACSAQLPYLRNEVFLQYNSDPASRKIYDFGSDYSLSKSSNDQYSTLLVPGLAKIAYSKDGISVVNESGKVVDNKYSKQKYSLGLAKAFILTKNDNSVVVYDNDDTDGETANLIFKNTKKLTSKNSKSINNPKFISDLKDAKKFQATIKPGIFYADTLGQKTKYEIKIEDFYTSYVRAVLSEASFRKANGGSDAADKAALDKYKNLSPNSTRFTSNGHFNNEYLFSLFGLDSSKLRTKNGYIQKLNGSDEKAITIESLPATENTIKKTETDNKNSEAKATSPSFDLLWDKMIIDSTYFSPVPTAYIQENNDKQNFANITGLAKESGYYWYGQKTENMLWAGSYIFSKEELAQSVYNFNPQYYDQEWVKNPDAIKSYVENYVGTDSSVFATNQFEAYKNGSTFILSFPSLNQQRQAEVLKPSNHELFNLNYTTPIDRNDINGFSFIPNFYVNNDVKDTIPYAYNDAVSLLLYGDTIENLKKGTSKDVNKHYWTGDGLIFRSLLSNAFNLFQYNQTLDDKASIWLSLARPNNLISGSDDSNAGSDSKIPLTLFDDNVKQNTIFALKLDKSKIEKDFEKDKKYAQDNFKDNKKANQSSTFENIKTEMKNLLDTFFGTNGKGKSLTGDNQKLTATFYSRYTNPGEKAISTFNNVVNTYNSLDSRINFKYEQLDGLKSWPTVLNNRALTYPNGWSYDYDGYGGFLGLFFYIQNNPLFPALFAFSEDNTTSTTKSTESKPKELDENLKKAFPEVVKLAKAYKEATYLFPSGAKNFNELKTNSTNKDWSTNVSKYLKGSATNFDPSSEYAKFAFAYQKKTKNEDLAKLNAELTSLIGINGVSRFLLARVNPVPILLNKNYLVPSFINRWFDYQYVFVKK